LLRRKLVEAERSFLKGGQVVMMMVRTMVVM